MSRAEPRNQGALQMNGAIGQQTEAIWTRFAVDPLATPFARWLARLRLVTPNRITAVAGACAVGAAVAFACGLFRLGGVLFIVRFFLDCLDGKVARAQGTSSTLGGILDLVADIGGIMICIAAISWRLLDDGQVEPAVPLLLLAAVAFYNWVLAARKQLAKQRGLSGDGGSGGRWTTTAPVLRSWVHLSHRLDMSPIPWAIEVEILCLGLLPLLAPDPRWIGIGLWLALAFYVVADAVNLRRVVGLAGQIDDERTPARAAHP